MCAPKGRLGPSLEPTGRISRFYRHAIVSGLVTLYHPPKGGISQGRNRSGQSTVPGPCVAYNLFKNNEKSSKCVAMPSFA